MELPSQSTETKPDWVKQLLASHESNFPQNDSTNLSRAFESADVLKLILVNLDIKTLAVLGPGFNSRGILQTVVPPVLAARLGNLNKPDFRMIVVDIDKRLPEVVRKPSIYVLLNTEEQKRDWQKYLTESKQEDWLVVDNEPDLELSDERVKQWRQRYPIHAAHVPEIYKHYLQTGRITTVVKDIAMGEWAGLASLDYIDCCHVLMHLSAAAQKLALWQISQALRQDGFVLIDDRDRGSSNVLFEQNGGWLGDEILREIRLRKLSQFNLPNKYMCLLEKY